MERVKHHRCNGLQPKIVPLCASTNVKWNGLCPNLPPLSHTPWNTRHVQCPKTQVRRTANVLVFKDPATANRQLPTAYCPPSHASKIPAVIKCHFAWFDVFCTKCVFCKKFLPTRHTKATKKASPFPYFCIFSVFRG